MKTATFNHIAQAYDADFTQSAIGRAQRAQVWRYLPDINECTTCLELNCGTGEDAREMATRGANVLATDISPQMVQVSKAKLRGYHKASAQVLDIENLSAAHLLGVNLLFSNFGGLNCLSPAAWQQFAAQLSQCEKQTKLVFVIMGRNCWWERLYFAFKGHKPWSRKGHKAVMAQVGQTQMPTWYYSPGEIQQYMPADFSMTQLRPVGFAIPPSYLEKWFSNKKALLHLLKFADKHFFPFKFWAPFADHFYIEFVKH